MSTQIERMGSLGMREEMLARAAEDMKILMRFYKDILQEGTDYGIIPGTQKPTLYQPGAEILARSMGMNADTKTVSKHEEFDLNAPFFFYEAESRIYNLAGEFLGNGLGSANTRETRYAFRWVSESKLPKGIDKSGLVSEERSGKYGKYTAYKVATPADEIYTMTNTVEKMACKRAFVAAVLRVTGASRIFTQDVEDVAHDDDAPAATASTSPTKADRSLEEVQFAFKDYPQVMVVEEEKRFVVTYPPNVAKNTFDSMKEIAQKMGGRFLLNDEGGPAFAVPTA